MTYESMNYELSMVKSQVVLLSHCSTFTFDILHTTIHGVVVCMSMGREIGSTMCVPLFMAAQNIFVQGELEKK